MKTLGGAVRRAALLAGLALAPGIADAQRVAYIPLDDPAMATVDALVARGALRGLSSLDRPYYAAAVRDAAGDALSRADSNGSTLVAPRAWYVQAMAAGERYAGRAMKPDGVSIEIDPFVTAQTTGHRELLLGIPDRSVEPGADVRFALDLDNIAAVARLQIDRSLKHDPEFAGKKDRVVAARMQDAYIGARWRYVSLMTGRVARNWGAGPLDGLQVANYADSYDHVYLRLGTDALNISSIVARLDDMTVGPDSVAQRYFTAHRLAARWRRLDLAASEAIVYGGIARGFEPSLANPLSLLDLAQYDAHQSLNVNYTLDLALRTARRGMYALQFLVDDFQVDKCNPNCKEPSSIGLTLLGEAVPTGTAARAFGSYTRVSNLTYRTPQPWERYSYLGLGLGRGQSDYDELRAGLELAPPLGGPLRLYAASRRQGAGDYRLGYPLPAQYVSTPGIFAGVVERVHRLGAAFSTSGRVSLSADAGYDWTTNADHVTGRSRNGFVARARLTLSPAFSFTRAVAQ